MTPSRLILLHRLFINMAATEIPIIFSFSIKHYIFIQATGIPFSTHRNQPGRLQDDSIYSSNTVGKYYNEAYF